MRCDVYLEDMEKKKGRPSSYNEKLALEICRRISEGESLRSVCRDDSMPDRGTVHDWILDKDNLSFYHQYERACNTRAENMFDELVEIADDGTNDFMERERPDGSTFEVVNTENIQRSRLRADVRKWYLSKVMPKKFGDKMDVTSDNKPLPQPIISLNALRGNISNEESTEPQ